MAILVLKLHGEERQRLLLESGNEYIAGRGQDTQIHLEEQRGISRHHLKFYEREGTWIVEALSKFGLIQQGNESLTTLELTSNTVFSIPPYEFHFELNEVAPAKTEEPAVSENLPAVVQPRLHKPSFDEEKTGAHSLGSDATVAVVANLTPYFRISYPNSSDEEVLRLEGSLWVAGRDSSCEITIESPHISRKHFELSRTADGFFITDLGSANGTKVNGQPLQPHEPTRLESGDEIRVMNVEMKLEIRDSQFSNRISNLPVPAFDPLLAVAPPGGFYPDLYKGSQELTQYNGPSQANKNIGKNFWQELRKNKVRMALVILAPILLIVALMPTKPKESPAARNQASPAYETLTQEKKLVVKDSFNLARNLYVQGKYALCLTELAKLHELIPQYENSKELQSFCEQGLELVRRQEDMERKERERAMIEAQINSYVETCKSKLGADSTIDETRQCLAPAIELAPEHPLVVEMIHTAQMHEDERKFMAQQKQVRDAKAAKGVAHFHKAMSTYKKGELWRTIGELEKFVNTPYPDSETIKDKARRQISSIKKELKGKVDSLLDQCKGLAGKNKYRDSYLACDQVIKEEPSQSAAKEIRSKMLAELRKEMKAIYEDSVLEESLGNVDSAKEKWRKIVNEDLPFDDYAKKARSKLKKYGAEP